MRRGRHTSRAKAHDTEIEEKPPVSEVLPKVSQIVIQMTYYQNLANPVLMVRTVNFFPTSPSEFFMNCMVEECEEGGFDLGPLLRKMMRGAKRSAKGKLNCKGKTPDNDKEHASIAYEISMKYKRKKK